MKSLLSICFRYRALFKYVPQNPDELEMFEGDTVMVLEKCDDGWFVGTSERYGLEKTYMFDWYLFTQRVFIFYYRTGCFGTFPGNYVQRI